MIKDLTKKPLYVCSTCGQDFTRRYNASRHNQNIHSNKAQIIRFLEYLIGTLSGKYLPGDPLLYRMKNRNKNRPNIVHENEDNNSCYGGRFDVSSIKSMLQPTAEPIENRIDGKNANFNNSTGSIKTRNNLTDDLNTLNDNFQPSGKEAKEFSQKQKIEEEIRHIERMLYDFYPPQKVQILVGNLIIKYNATTDYTGFRKNLENYRSTLVGRYLHPR
jgi:hypothetical protein